MAAFCFRIQTVFLLCGILSTFLLSACSPNFAAPSNPGASPPSLSAHAFRTGDNTELPLKAWVPADDTRGVIIAVHGFNDYSNFIKSAAPFFNQHHLAVYAYDQRGFGATETSGRWSGWQTLSRDLTAFIRLAGEGHPDVPVYILGDSMGGAVTIVTMTLNDPPEVDGVILVAPAVWARSEMPFYQRWLLWIAAHTVPWKKVTGKSLDLTASDNVAMLKELGKDPLVIKETRIDVLYGLSNLMDEAYRRAELFNAKTLVLYGKKDEIIPRQPVFEFFRRLPAALEGEQQMVLYENGYHMLLRDLQSEIVLEDIVDWIHEPEQPLPSIRNKFAKKVVNTK